MKSTFATVVWLSATMKLAEATAVQPATASSARPIEVNAVTVPPPLREPDEGEQGNGREESSSRDLRRRSDRQLSLQDARARPGQRRKRHVHLAAATDARAAARSVVKGSETSTIRAPCQARPARLQTRRHRIQTYAGEDGPAGGGGSAAGAVRKARAVRGSRVYSKWIRAYTLTRLPCASELEQRP